MAGETVDEIVLAAMGLVRDHHDVAALGEGRVGVPLLFGEELLDRGEYDSSGLDGQPPPQVGSALSLHGWLAQEVMAAGEGSEELVVQIVAIGQDDDRGVRHGRLADDGPGIKGHGQALSRALGVPDHADAPVPKFAAGFSA